MEKKENTGTKLNVLLCNLVDYVRGDDRPLVFAVMQEITEYFDQELDKAREEGRLSVIQELLFEPEEPSHNIGTLEAAFKYEDIIKRYSGEWRNKTGLVSPKYIKSKLKDNK